MSVSREVLRHDVGEHVGCRKVCGFDGVPFAGITDEVEADTDKIESLSEYKQWGHCSACLYRILPYNMRAYEERTQMASFTATEAPMYSTSTVEKATSGC